MKNLFSLFLGKSLSILISFIAIVLVYSCSDDQSATKNQAPVRDSIAIPNDYNHLLKDIGDQPSDPPKP